VLSSTTTPGGGYGRVDGRRVGARRERRGQSLEHRSVMAAAQLIEGENVAVALGFDDGHQ
jgi:hypothetical protein